MSSLFWWWSQSTTQDANINQEPGAIEASDELVLTGKDSTECEDWIQSIQKAAFAQGKTSDKAWMAALASTRIRGRALRWYSQQSDDVTSDWTKLRAAALDEYCAEAPGPSAPNHSSIPTPPAAPPTDLSQGRPYRNGYVKVRWKGSSWLSKTPRTEYLYANYQTGTISIGPEPNCHGRLTVRLGPNEVSNGISLVTPAAFKEFKAQLAWLSSPVVEMDINSTDDAQYRCAMLVLGKPSGDVSSPLMAATILSDGLISVSACYTGSSFTPLRALINTTGIFFTTTPDKYRYVVGGPWRAAELVFDPIA